MSRRIRLSDEASERLASLKRKDESFSGVVFRLSDDRSLHEIAGILDDEAAEAVRESVDRRRNRRRERLEEIAEEIRED